MKQKWAILLTLVLWWHASFAAEPTTLQIRPHTCVVDATGSCDVKVQVSFDAEQKIAVCFLIEQKDLIFCQPHALHHELTVQLEVSENTKFAVVDAKDGRLLGVTWLNLASYEPNSTRKRRRFSWSFDQ